MANEIIDEYIVATVAEWQVARAKAILSWAENDRDNLFGCRSGVIPVSPEDALKTMYSKQKKIAEMRPSSTRGVRALLLVALLILQHRAIDPDGSDRLSDGPLLEIILNLFVALDNASEMTLRNEG